jgi:hypothetical protein
MAAWMLPVAMMAGSAALSMYRDQKKNEATEKFNKGQAEITRYSPWTGMKGEVRPIFNDPVGSGLQGGLTGASLYGSMKGAGMFDGDSGGQTLGDGRGGEGALVSQDQVQGMGGDMGNARPMTADQFQQPQMGSYYARKQPGFGSKWDF